jgi:hypothetical protein
MYSPKIAEKLIPALYHTAKDRGVPMAALVNRLLTEALPQESLPPMARLSKRLILTTLHGHAALVE